MSRLKCREGRRKDGPDWRSWKDPGVFPTKEIGVSELHTLIPIEEWNDLAEHFAGTEPVEELAIVALGLELYEPFHED